jgi:aldehyde dehydrogenase (NAD+)
MLIDGALVDADSGATFANINPATEEVIGHVADASVAEMQRAIAAARRAFDETDWSTNRAFRKQCLEQLQVALEAEREELREQLILEVGCPRMVTQGPQLDGPLESALRYPAKLIDEFPWEVDLPETAGMTGAPNVRKVWREPAGVVGAIVPWNFPILLATWKLAPALAAGNTLVVKPSEFTSASILELMPLFEQAGFPPGVVNVVTGTGGRCGAALTSHPGIDRIAFTGGPETAIAIARSAAERLIPATFELGGKSANIVFEDAQLKAAEAGVLAGIFAASGQTCIAGSRLLVQRSIQDEFVARIVARAQAIRLGDPTDPETQMGPAATPAQLEKIKSFVAEAVSDGATIAAGGGVPDDPALTGGLFHEPTVLTGVRPEMRIAQEEVFGPVLAVIGFEDEADAVRSASRAARR